MDLPWFPGSTSSVPLRLCSNARSSESERHVTRFAQRRDGTNDGRGAHLPDYDEYDKLLRYQISSESSAERALRQLETLQRARSDTLPPPVRIQGLEP